MPFSSTENPGSPNRAGYNRVMALATLGATGLGVLVCVGLGGDATAVKACLGAIVLGSLATLGPILMRFSIDYWGVAVMVAGAARIALALAVCYIVREINPGLSPRPMFLGVGSAMFILLVVEVMASVRVLSAADRLRTAGQPSERNAA